MILLVFTPMAVWAWSILVGIANLANPVGIVAATAVACVMAARHRQR